MLRSTISRPVYLGIKHPSGLTSRFLLLLDSCVFFFCGALSLTRGRVCRLQLLPPLASAVIHGSEAHWTRDHILLSRIRDFPFRRLLRLAGLRWRYSTQPPHGKINWIHEWTLFYKLGWTDEITLPSTVCILHYDIRCNGNVLTEPLLSNRLFQLVPETCVS
jgi:hypothetical protein